MVVNKFDGRAFDVVVIGNGVLGLSLALTLVRQKVRVALVGEAHRPWAASTAAGAMLGCFGEVTTTLLKSEYGRTKLEFDVRARKQWDDWLVRLASDAGDADIFVADGTMVILNTVGLPGIDDANFVAIREALRRYKEPFEDIDPADIEWLDPEPDARPLRAFYIPNEHAVNAAGLLERLERAFMRLDGTLISKAATQLKHNKGRIEGLTLSSGEELATNCVVLAAGVRSQDLLNTVPDVAARIPRLISGYGVSALVHTEDASTPRHVIRTPNRAFACGLHVVPRQKGKEVYVGATNIISPEPLATPAVRDVLFLLECATRQVRRNLSISGLHRIQVGNRPVALDGFPLLGQTDLNGLWLMTGTYRDGLHLSPFLAQEMSRCIQGEQPEVDLSMFHPVRAPIQPMSREEVVDTAVTHMLATGYEYGWNIPIAWPEIIDYNLRPSYEKFANDLDPLYTPPSEILAASRQYPEILQRLRDYYAEAHNA
jgi:glycine oxidase